VYSTRSCTGRVRHCGREVVAFVRGSSAKNIGSGTAVLEAKAKVWQSKSTRRRRKGNRGVSTLFPRRQPQPQPQTCAAALVVRLVLLDTWCALRSARVKVSWMEHVNRTLTDCPNDEPTLGVAADAVVFAVRWHVSVGGFLQSAQGEG
jgi:hypothetical protein